MTRIDFYHDVDDKLRFACRLTAKAVARNLRVLVFAPDGGSRTVGEQPPLNFLISPVLRHRPLHAGRLRGRHVFMDGALGKRTTASDLMLAQSKGLEPQNFFQLTHGQPFLWQLGVSTYQWSQVTTAALRRRSNPMPITVPNYNRKTDRLQFGTLIGITSES